MVADVPVGLFLSGGYDSATTAACLTQTHNALKTFTVAVPEAGLNEGPKAKQIADYLGTTHTEITCDLLEALQVIPMLPLLLMKLGRYVVIRSFITLMMVLG